MIKLSSAKAFCRDDISKIENYDKAVADEKHSWHCHHRLELTHEGDFANDVDTLKRMNMYFNRPYFELIFLPECEHKAIHMSAINKLGLNQEIRDKISKNRKGKSIGHVVTAETRKKISLANSERKFTLGLKWFNNGEINKRAHVCPEGFAPGRINYNRG